MVSGISIGLPHNATARVAVPGGCSASIPLQPSLLVDWIEYGPAPGVLTLINSPPASSSSIFGDFYVQPSSIDTFIQVRVCGWGGGPAIK